MNKQKIWLLAGLIVILIGLIILVVKNVPPKNIPAPYQNNLEPTAPVTESPDISTTSTDEFKAAVPENIKVPAAGEIIPEAKKKEIAVPTVVVAAAPGVTSSFRNFNISGEGGKFIPAKVIASLGDTIHINFTAVDRDYDIVFPSYNMRQTAKQGQTKTLEFQAISDGDFLYYCAACGGPDSAAVGHIIVVK